MVTIRYGFIDPEQTMPYAEIMDKRGGKEYVVRMTAIPPYRSENNELRAHIDYMDVAVGETRRYEAVMVPAPRLNEKRRHPMLRLFRSNRGKGISIKSPVRLTKIEEA